MKKLTTKEIIDKNMEYLENNDLAGFYKALYDKSNGDDAGSYDAGDIGEISRFLDEDCGIYIEHYLDYIPECYCHTPDRWIENTVFGDTFTIPPNIKMIKMGAFVSKEMHKKGVFCVDVNRVEFIGAFAFAGAGFMTLLIGKELNGVHSEFLTGSGITKIFYDKDCDDRIIESIKKIIEKEHFPTEMYCKE